MFHSYSVNGLYYTVNITLFTPNCKFTLLNGQQMLYTIGNLVFGLLRNELINGEVGLQIYPNVDQLFLLCFRALRVLSLIYLPSVGQSRRGRKKRPDR